MLHVFFYKLSQSYIASTSKQLKLFRDRERVPPMVKSPFHGTEFDSDALLRARDGKQPHYRVSVRS